MTVEVLDDHGRAFEVEFVLCPAVISVWFQGARTADFGFLDFTAWLDDPSEELSSPPVALGDQHTVTVATLPAWQLSPLSVAGLRLLTTKRPAGGPGRELHPMLAVEAANAVAAGRVVQIEESGMIIY